MVMLSDNDVWRVVRWFMVVGGLEYYWDSVSVAMDAFATVYL